MPRPVKPNFVPPSTGQTGFGRAASQALLDLPGAMQFLDASNDYQMTLFEAPNDAIVVGGDKPAEGLSVATARRPLFLNADGDALTTAVPERRISFLQQATELPSATMVVEGTSGTRLVIPNLPASPAYGLRYSYYVEGGNQDAPIRVELINDAGDVIASQAGTNREFEAILGGSGVLFLGGADAPFIPSAGVRFRLFGSTGTMLTITSAEILLFDDVNYTVTPSLTPNASAVSNHTGGFIPSDDGAVVRVCFRGFAFNSRSYEVRYADGARELIASGTITIGFINDGTSQECRNTARVDTRRLIETTGIAGSLVWDDTTYATSSEATSTVNITALPAAFTVDESILDIPILFGQLAGVADSYIFHYAVLVQGDDLLSWDIVDADGNILSLGNTATNGEGEFSIPGVDGSNGIIMRATSSGAHTISFLSASIQGIAHDTFIHSKMTQTGAMENRSVVISAQIPTLINGRRLSYRTGVRNVTLSVPTRLDRSLSDTNSTEGGRFVSASGDYTGAALTANAVMFSGEDELRTLSAIPGHVNGYRFLEIAPIVDASDTRVNNNVSYNTSASGTSGGTTSFTWTVARSPSSGGGLDCGAILRSAGGVFSTAIRLDGTQTAVINLGADRSVEITPNGIFCTATDSPRRRLDLQRSVSSGIFFIRLTANAGTEPGSLFTLAIGAYSLDDYVAAFSIGNGYDSLVPGHSNNLTTAEHISNVALDTSGDDRATITGVGVRVFDVQLQSGGARAIVAGAQNE